MGHYLKCTDRPQPSLCSSLRNSFTCTAANFLVESQRPTELGNRYIGKDVEVALNLTLHDVVLSNVVVMILGFLASLSPAWRASRYEPVEAITKV